MEASFAYHSPRPSDYRDIGTGACVGRTQVSHTGNLEHMAGDGAIKLELEPGIYIAVLEGSNSTGDVIGWSWIIEVTAPKSRTARVVKSDDHR